MYSLDLTDREYNITNPNVELGQMKDLISTSSIAFKDFFNFQ